MKVQCLMRSPILNAVEHEVIRFELVYHCLSSIICIFLPILRFHYLLAWNFHAKSDDLTL